jgi:hypothetical protein
MSTIPDTLEAEIRKTVVQGSPSKMIGKPPIIAPLCHRLDIVEYSCIPATQEA